MPARSALPALDTRRHLERVRLTRLTLSREIALEGMLASTVAWIGRKAAGHYHFNRSADGLDFSKALDVVLRPSLRETARAFGLLVGEKSAGIGLELKLFGDLDADTDAYIAEHVATRVVQISDSLRAMIREIVRRGLEDGQGTEEIAQAIQDATEGEMAMARARRIARTETHTASMVGQFGAARASPLEWRKTWLATEDSRTREGHAEANGQERDLEEPFHVRPREDDPYEEMMFPGDPDASPANSVNCRCVCTFDPVLE